MAARAEMGHNMRGKLQQFMMGRYGVDQFARFLNFSVIILLVISMLTRLGILYLLALALMVYSYYRIFRATVRSAMRRI